ncbi:inosine/xanthosine triphosphatase [Piscirickettsia salmonis]|uniref:inosine/xanthosine triphosphatase n=1 Tax=Piscirickettsia salmonis TaxID=1238 RepID=UPI0007C905D1|nr:Non-canonical purine NTP phosphatase [Piscirickettsiaceae bacterium NZ-RLO1]
MKKDEINVVVGSQNPVKVSAAREVIVRYYPKARVFCQGVAAPSQVADQPMSEQDTRMGALNRVAFCKEYAAGADFYMAMEGGADCFEYGAATFAYVVIDHQEYQSIGRSANLPLSKVIYQALIDGEELGQVMDRLFHTQNIKHKGGAIALLTNGHASRKSCYIEALTLAMTPFLHAELYDL